MASLTLDLVLSEARGVIGQDKVTYHGVTLPAPNLRACGPHFNDDAYYLASAEREARKLVDRLGMTGQSRVLDIGCGVGRLPIGILQTAAPLQSYTGIDVKLKSIRWCKRNLERLDPRFRFLHIDVKNDRYNPSGGALAEDFHLPIGPNSVDIIYLYSVFSHMTTRDIEIYLREFSRVLSDRGRVYLTTFLEQDVPDISVNPDQYRAEWAGPLHCVRFNQDYFVSLLEQSGLQLDAFDYADEDAGQSSVYASKRAKVRL
jgi:ubiquinone/menaquinone biosynthesis C-methylase UbiE